MNKKSTKAKIPVAVTAAKTPIPTLSLRVSSSSASAIRLSLQESLQALEFRDFLTGFSLKDNKPSL